MGHHHTLGSFPLRPQRRPWATDLLSARQTSALDLSLPFFFIFLFLFLSFFFFLPSIFFHSPSWETKAPKSPSFRSLARALQRHRDFGAIDRVLSAFGAPETTRDDRFPPGGSAAKAWSSGRLRKVDEGPALNAAFYAEPLTSSALESAFGHWA